MTNIHSSVWGSKTRTHFSVGEIVKAEVGERLKRFAQEKFGSLRAFAEVVGTNSNQLSFYTTGKRMPGGELLAKFYDLAGMNINWLLTGEGPMEAQEYREGTEGNHVIETDVLAAYFDEVVSPEQIIEWMRKRRESKRVEGGDIDREGNNP